LRGKKATIVNSVYEKEKSQPGEEKAHTLLGKKREKMAFAWRGKKKSGNTRFSREKVHLLAKKEAGPPEGEEEVNSTQRGEERGRRTQE